MSHECNREAALRPSLEFECISRVSFAESYRPRPDGNHIDDFRNWRKIVARKTVLVCDSCGKEVEEGKGAVLRVTFNDARRGAKAADLCDSCAGGMPGAAVARRGRKPKSLA
jgi:hypothetical protein